MFYEKNEQFEDARYVYQREMKVVVKNVDELANVCCEWAEMELRLKFVSNYNLFSD